MIKVFRLFIAAIAAISLVTTTSCSSNDNEPTGPVNLPAHGLFVVNNGNYGTPNASVSFYNPTEKSVQNNIFHDANDMLLGDVAQSMTISGNTAWICVNNSNVIFAVDATTMVEKGRITDIPFPRNILFIDAHKAYVTSLYTNQITVVDPTTYSVIGKITIPGMDNATGSTEALVKAGNYVYVNCWSYQNTILKIDPATDKLVDQLEVGIQPCSMAYDQPDNLLWVLNDGGGWDGNPIGYVAPSIVAVDLATFAIARGVYLTLGSSVDKLIYYNGYLYWLDSGVMKMSVNDTQAPSAPFIPCSNGWYYALTINPSNGEIYVGNALDYSQNGIVERYDSTGKLLDTFSVGIAPCSFCWK